jgi:hypothetical protein
MRFLPVQTAHPKQSEISLSILIKHDIITGPAMHDMPFRVDINRTMTVAAVPTGWSDAANLDQIK